MTQVANSSGPFDPFNPAADNDLSLSALVRSIRLSDSYALLFAVCNQNGLRDRLIKEIKERLPGTTFDEIRLSEPIPNLFRFFETRYPGDQSPPGPVMIYGIEAWIPSGKEGENFDFVLNLNITRDLFPTVLNRPLILWLPEHALTTIFHASPDFFSARSGTFFFADTTEEHKGMLTTMDTMGLEGIAGLPLEQKRDRIASIENLLAEYDALPPEKKDPGAEIRLRRAAADIYYIMGEYQKAEPLFHKEVEWARHFHGPESTEYATAINNLALLLKITNRFVEAEPLMRRALEIDMASFGPDHPKVAVRLNNLAKLLEDTNRFSEAEPLMRRALQIDETSFGLDHPSVATDLNNLATLLLATNRLAEAERLMRRSLQIEESSFGPDHPNVATGLNNLASLLQTTNRLAEAEPLIRRALAIDEASLGPNHPNVATRLNNLALLLQVTNRLDKAEPLMRRALQIHEASFGPDHTDVGANLNNLAGLLLSMNRLAEAEPLIRRALKIVESSFGHDNPKVAISLDNLAMVEEMKGNYTEAENMLFRALDIFRRSYRDDNHPHIQETLHRLEQIRSRSATSSK